MLKLGKSNFSVYRIVPLLAPSRPELVCLSAEPPAPSEPLPSWWFLVFPFYVSRTWVHGDWQLQELYPKCNACNGKGKDRFPDTYLNTVILDGLQQSLSAEESPLVLLVPVHWPTGELLPHWLIILLICRTEELQKLEDFCWCITGELFSWGLY